MVSLKCKMCAGELNIKEGESVAICEYCGSKQTVPSIDDEKKVNLFARANRLRFACEFDKASSVYESIIADFPEEAEAYWGLVLCKYGIEYVDDPATSKKIPTCHRTSFESVMDDNNFEQIMENSDVASRIVYREEAKQIEELRKNIIEVSSKEEPYDIFICYKETDEDGNRTIDSVLAQDIYDELNQKGYRVFFSRITLEDKLGKEYEPFIFSALNSAKVMLVFGTSYDNFNGVWVKNEWSRFLQLISKGEKKVLIPCFKDIDAYDMPKEFAKLQAQDLGKVGAIQDLIRGIEKIIPKKADSNSTQTIASEVTADTLLERAYILLKNGDYSEANNYFNKVLDRSPKESKAYWGKLLSAEKCIDNIDLTSQQKIHYYFNRLLSQKSALAYSDEEFTTKLKSLWGSSYINACEFASSVERKSFEDCFEKVKKAVIGLLHNEQVKRQEEINRIESEKRREAELLRQKQEQEKEKEYVFAIEKMESSQSYDEFCTTQKLFINLRQYKDSEKYAKECGEKAEAFFQQDAERIDKSRKTIEIYKDKIVASYSHCIGLKNDGTVIAVGDNKYGQCNVNKWDNIIGIACSGLQTVGLKSDKTVVSCGSNDRGQNNVQAWKNIKKIVFFDSTTIGLKYDGTIVSTQTDKYDFSNYHDIVDIVCSSSCIVFLSSDKRVFAQSDDYWTIRAVESWTDITNVYCHDKKIVGLKQDGTLVAAGDFSNYEKEIINEQKRIIDIALNTTAIAFLRKDGVAKVYHYGKKEPKYVWQNIIKIYVGFDFIGLKQDNTIEYGYLLDGIENWTDIIFIEFFGVLRDTPIGLKKDGTLVMGALKQRCKEIRNLLKYKLLYTEDELKQIYEKKKKEEQNRIIKKSLLNERSLLETELNNLKGLFVGKRKNQILARIDEINNEIRTRKL